MDDEKNCDCIKMLEELIDLPRQISLMDLGELRKVDQYIRGIWIEDIKRRQQEYYLKYIPKCGLDEPSKCLIGYIYLAMLKLAICFKEKGEEIPPNVIDQSMERSMELLQKLERELPVVRRLSAEKLAEYFHDKIRKGESGFFTLILDAVHKGKNPLDGILEDPDIPDSLAKMIFNIYSKEINKMKEAAKIYIDRYGLPQIYYELDRILEKAKKERANVGRRVGEEYKHKSRTSVNGVRIETYVCAKIVYIGGVKNTIHTEAEELVISGVKNVIYVKNSDVRMIRLSGVKNVVYIPVEAYPVVENSGVNCFIKKI